MRINAKKTKEMVLSFQKEMPDVAQIQVDGQPLERVERVTLLGLRISSSLTWGDHFEHIVKKAQQRLFCLTLFKRSKLLQKDIVKVYCSKIRPVLEYACAVWHSSLTDEQCQAIEHVQERAMHIIFPNLDYQSSVLSSNIPSLNDR